MSSVTSDETRTESDYRHKRDEANGHAITSRKPLIKKDSQFKITTPNCNVLQHLIRPAAMVAVPDVLTEKEDAAERKDDVHHVAIVTAENQEALWWDVDTLKTSAPDLCAKEAMFNMTVSPPDPKVGGESVIFRSCLMDKYLIVVEDLDQPDHDQPTQPQFKFKLSPNPDDGVTNTFVLGTAAKDDDPNYRFLRFLYPKDNKWYYWYVDGGEIGIRMEEASMDPEVFNTMIVKDCN